MKAPQADDAISSGRNKYFSSSSVEILKIALWSNCMSSNSRDAACAYYDAAGFGTVKLLPTCVFPLADIQ
jgi:hypothetical protein